MRLGVFGILAAAAVAQASEHRELKAQDVGLLHTEAFDQLGDIFSNKENMDSVDMMMEVSKISAAFCPPNDAQCSANAYKATVTEFDRASSGNRIIEYPKDFNLEVRAQLNKMHRTMRDYDGSEYEHVMHTLEEIQNDLQDMENVDTASQIVGLSSVSVAMESTKLWTSAYSDPEHKMHRSLTANGHEGHRKLQIVYEEVILADVNATLANAIDLLDTLGTNNPFSIFAVPPVFFVAIVQYAIPASVIAAYPESAP